MPSYRQICEQKRISQPDFDRYTGCIWHSIWEVLKNKVICQLITYNLSLHANVRGAVGIAGKTSIENGMR